MIAVIVRLPAAAETFGHIPGWINPGACGGCNVCGDVEEQEICVRCWDRWPCGTARILNIVDKDGDLIEPFAAQLDGANPLDRVDPWEGVRAEFGWAPDDEDAPLF